jgi:hypothetical protein
METWSVTGMGGGIQRSVRNTLLSPSSSNSIVERRNRQMVHTRSASSLLCSMVCRGTHTREEADAKGAAVVGIPPRMFIPHWYDSNGTLTR